MTIGIDARFAGPKGTGIGKYVEKLILNLQKLDAKNKYKIFLKKESLPSLKLANRNFQKVLADVPWYSIEEQIKMSTIYTSQNLDLLHVPHFNVPIFYKRKFIVTIHDLIHLDFPNTSSSTKNVFLFKAKRLGFKKILSHAVKKSSKIITPSNHVKREIIKKFKISPSQIKVIYEAAEEEYFSNQKPKTKNQKPFLVYVGNAYPYKNLNNLLEAIKLLNNNPTDPPAHKPINLTIVSPRDVFSKRLESEIKARDLESRVELKGYQETEDLVGLFQKASAYIFPSLSEGFGIPGLNAMAAGVPVVASNIPTLKEVYSDAAMYFNPKDPKDITEKIDQVLLSQKIKNSLIEKGNKQANKYSWQKMAKETLKIYESV